MLKRNIKKKTAEKRQQKLDPCHQRPCFRHPCGNLPLVLPSSLLFSDLNRKSERYWTESIGGATDVTNWNRISSPLLTSNVLFPWPWCVCALQACFATWAPCREVYLACKQCLYNAGEGSSVKLVWEWKHQFPPSAVWPETSLICWRRWRTVVFRCFGKDADT